MTILDLLKITNFTFYETLEDEPIRHKNFTFLRQGSYEIPGVRHEPPPQASNVITKP